MNMIAVPIRVRFLVEMLHPEIIFFSGQSHLVNLWKEDLLECLKDDVRGRDPLEEHAENGNSAGWFQVKCPFMENLQTLAWKSAFSMLKCEMLRLIFLLQVMDTETNVISWWKMDFQCWSKPRPVPSWPLTGETKRSQFTKVEFFQSTKTDDVSSKEYLMMMMMMMMVMLILVIYDDDFWINVLMCSSFHVSSPSGQSGPCSASKGQRLVRETQWFLVKDNAKSPIYTTKTLPDVTNPIFFFWKSPKNKSCFSREIHLFRKAMFFVFGSRFQNLMEMTSFHENFTQAKVDSSSLGGTGDPFGWIGWWKFWGC